MKALLNWLESNRYSGTAVDETATTTTEVEAAIGGNRVFEYEQADGESVRFSYSGDIVFLDSFRSMQLYWTIASASPGTFNATEFEEALDDELITVDGIMDSQEKPPFGSTEIAVNAQRINMDRMMLENEADHPVIEFKDERDRTQRLILGYGLSVNHDDLLNFSAGVKQTPRTWGVNEIHFLPGETSDGTIRMLNPVDQIPVPGVDWVCTYHNRHATRPYEIQYWDGENCATLLPTERTTLRMTRNEDGTGAVVDAVPLTRRLEFEVGNSGNFGSGSYYDWQSGGFRARPIPYPSQAQSSVWTMHGECFAFGNEGLTSGTGLFDATQTELSIPQAVIFQKPGKIRANMFVAIATSGGGGSVPDNHGLAFIRQFGSTVLLGPYLTNELIGNNENEVWQLGWEFDAAIDDIFLPLFRYSQTTNIGLSNVAIESINFKVEMKEFVYKEYTP